MNTCSMIGRFAGAAWQCYYVIVVAMVEVSHTIPTSMIIVNTLSNKSLVGMVYLLHIIMHKLAIHYI